MDKELITLIDTIVKIGLGALISGVSAYVLGSQKNNHENTKISKSEYRVTIKEIVAYIENTETLVNRYTATLQRDGVGDFDLLINAEHEAYQARGLSHLLGKVEISAQVDAYARFIEEIYSAAFLRNYKQYSTLIHNWSEHRNSIYKLL